MIRIAVLALALAAALAGPVRAQEAAVTRRATELRAQPADSARSLASLPAQASVTRGGERRGPWVQVRTEGGATGWLHLFDLGPASPAAAPATGSDLVGGALRGVTSLFGNRPPAQASTSAGIRGLGAEDIAQANPDPAAVTRMEGLRQSEQEARAFAAGAALRPVAVPPLAAPAGRAAPAPAAAADQPQSP